MNELQTDCPATMDARIGFSRTLSPDHTWRPGPEHPVRRGTCGGRAVAVADTLARAVEFMNRTPNRTTLADWLVTSGVSSL